MASKATFQAPLPDQATPDTGSMSIRTWMPQGRTDRTCVSAQVADEVGSGLAFSGLRVVGERARLPKARIEHDRAFALCAKAVHKHRSPRRQTDSCID